jgi:glycosyltransferase involved in cell wall biosynthesis
MVEHMVRLAEDPGLRDRLGDAARREATRFTWERTAHDTLAVLAADLVRRRGH